MNGLPSFRADPRDPGFFSDPYPHYRKMRALGPAFVWEEYDLVCFARYGEVDAILRDRRFGREITHILSREEAGLEPVRPGLEPFHDFEANTMLEREPPVHTRLRGLVNRAFVSRRIERLRPRIAALAHELLDAVAQDGEADLLPVFAEKIPVIIIAELLGVPVDMADQLLDWSHKMVAMYQFNRDRSIEDAAVAATLAFSDFIETHIDRRRSEPGEDLITALIAAEEAGDRLSRKELVATCILLLNAGHEATVHGLGNAIKALIENDVDVSEQFAAPASAIAAADELLRFDAPLHLFTRYVLEDLEIGGCRLRQGQSIGLLLGSANRDERRFSDPDRLDFARGGSGHVSFGAGIHFCLGAPLARLEMAVALPILFDRLKGLKLTERPVWSDRYHFHGLKALRVRW